MSNSRIAEAKVENIDEIKIGGSTPSFWKPRLWTATN
jgi:hypothetical protein